MRDAGYIVAGYVLTGATVTIYALSVRLRLRRALHGTEQSLPRGDAR